MSAELASALGVLRARGMRASAARRLVLEALLAADGPVPAEEIAAGLGGRVPPSDLASTYRNLETLERVGLVQHSHLGHGPRRYALADACEREYLVCERCHTVVSARSADLEGVRAAVRRAFRFEARFSHFPLAGLCATCVAAER